MKRGGGGGGGETYLRKWYQNQTLNKRDECHGDDDDDQFCLSPVSGQGRAGSNYVIVIDYAKMM